MPDILFKPDIVFKSDGHILFFKQETHEYFLDGVPVPSVTQVLQACGLSDFSMVDPETLTRSMNFGTAVHKVVELDVLGKLDEESLDGKLLPSLSAWRNFIKNVPIKIISIESKVFSVKYGYAGTKDILGTFVYENDLAIVDIKTGVPTISHPIQTAAYMAAYKELSGEKKKIRRFCLYLKEDKYRLVEHTSSLDFNVFLSGLQIWKYKNRK